MLIKWDDISSVNVKELDGHHKKLVSIINELFEVKGVNNPEEINRLLDELTEYANYHLAAEEKYFKDFSYPDKANHEAQHQSYRDTIVKFRDSYHKSADPAVLSELTKFLGAWWINHINHQDIKYSDCFNQHGLY